MNESNLSKLRAYVIIILEVEVAASAQELPVSYRQLHAVSISFCAAQLFTENSTSLQSTHLCVLCFLVSNYRPVSLPACSPTFMILLSLVFPCHVRSTSPSASLHHRYRHLQTSQGDFQHVLPFPTLPRLPALLLPKLPLLGLRQI